MGVLKAGGGGGGGGGGGSFPIRKIMLRFFGKGKALRAPISRTKAQHFFPKIGWGGGQRPFGSFPKIHQIWYR